MAEVKQVFDPRALGFDVVLDGKCSQARVGRSDYILRSRTKGGNIQYMLSLCEDTGDSAEILFGDTVAVAFKSSNGSIVVYNGNDRKMSMSNNGRCKRRMIAISSMSKELEKCFGRFRRVYFDAKVWSGGNAILLVPNGDIDEWGE